MYKVRLFIYILFFAVFGSVLAQNYPTPNIIWDKLPELPPASTHVDQKGLAGGFSGIHNDAMIFAGGANFPDKSSWEGGEKRYWDDIYVLVKDGVEYRWHVSETKLSQPLAYGVSVQTDKGLLCIGGLNKQEVSNQVFLISWDPVTEKIDIKSLSDMPVSLAMMAGSRVGNEVFIAGGVDHTNGLATKHFYVLDLIDYTWEKREPWPGPERIVPVAATQSDGETNSFFLFSGRKTMAGRPTQILSDVYQYHPVKKQWLDRGFISVDQKPPSCVMAATAIPSGANHILVIGGDRGEIFMDLEGLDREISVSKDPSVQDSLLEVKQKILIEHPGFSREVLVYHTITNTWTEVDQVPFESQVTTNAFYWDNQLIIPSGEVKPGRRTSIVNQGIIMTIQGFGWINYSVIGIYLAVLVGMGFYFARNRTNTHDYFKAGNRIPWWAAGLSIYGTQLSASTFMAIPAKTYATDWSFFMFNMTIIMIAPIVVYLFLPFYRRLNITTAYEYLEMRFNLAARLIGSSMLILFQLARIGIVLFLPAIALSIVTGIDVSLCILLMGLLSILYTVLGGIEAVVWTDVLQVIVLLGGAILCMILIPLSLDGGWSEMMTIAIDQNKFNILNFKFDWTTGTFWVVLLGGIGSNLISYGSDQVVVQRYLTTKNEKSAAQSIWTGTIMAIPGSVIFFGLGTALYAFYVSHPEFLNITLENTDAIFPQFIVSKLPQGVAGLVIAGVFAAAMSSLDSSMNSVATVITTDFYQRFKPTSTEASRLNLAKWTTAIIGVAGTLFALLMATWDIKSLWDQLNTFIGLFAGGLGGLFLLGICTRRANGFGAVVGLIVSGFVQWYVKEFTAAHFFLYAVTGTLSCLIVGYLASLVGGLSKDTTGLTMYSMGKRND